MTTYQDLTTYGRWLIDQRLTRELKDFRKSSIWWAKRGEVSTAMLGHFKSFIKFRRRVLDGHDLIACLQEWVGCYAHIDSYEFAMKRNVPQLSFCDEIQQALRELQEYRDIDPTEGASA